MLWTLLLAHFLGDFPLQNNWMARCKWIIRVLSLHVSIHFILMLLLVGQSRITLWPYLLLLTLVHMGQDRLKIYLTDLWPNRMVVLFYLDQLFHSAAIWGLVRWLQINQPQLIVEQNSTWAIIAIAYLVVTYVWYICERVMNHADPEYLKNVEQTKLSRMLSRSGMVSLFFLIRGWVLPNTALLLSWPYPDSIYRVRALTTDLTVSITAFIFLFLTLGLG